MKKRFSYVAAALVGSTVLGTMVMVGYVQQAVDQRAPERTGLGKDLTERQALERRRGRMAEVAIAGATAQ